ncbi:MAG TPA: DUF1109 domain-containing protein [Rhizomicrobium sp.]|jgi:hypothetical protein|nr:DUF1109 domain-containing protein [Rhizomicrobium sp.]
MKTDDLIAALATDLEPVPQRAVGARLALGLALGAAVSTALMMLWLGVRPDLMPAMMTGPFWMKFAYAFSVVLLGFGLIDRLARPDGEGGVFGPMILAPLGVMLALALYQLIGASHAERMALMMGGSYQVCARNIVILSLPIFAGLFWSLKALAPTRLTLAGAIAGVLAGAAGTFIYAFHCTESAAPFVAIWYTLGIAATGLVGAALGRLLLRW